MASYNGESHLVDLDSLTHESRAHQNVAAELSSSNNTLGSTTLGSNNLGSNTLSSNNLGSGTMGSNNLGSSTTGITSSTGTTTGTDLNASLQNAGNSVANSRSSAHLSYQNAVYSPSLAASNVANTIANHPVTQNAIDTVQNGQVSPVGQAVSSESKKTSAEFSDLLDARQQPNQTAANGQPLTQYHSLFYRLLSWRNPRATGITFATTVALIFAVRYLDIISYFLKASYIVMGITAAAEIAGKATINTGLASQMRPRKYWTIPKESLERLLDDVEQLINFFVIETQRIVFVENVYVTLAAFVASFVSYFLVKFVPLWGLTLIADSFVFLAPLVYVSNKEFIDQNLRNASNVITEQASQVKDLAGTYTGQASETVRAYAGEYTSKAQQLMGQTEHRNRQKITSEDFPNAPKTNLGTTTAAQKEFPAAPVTSPPQPTM